MNCLVEFLMDSYQKKLIEMIQNREETYEQALESYKKLFIKELVHCVGRNLGAPVVIDENKEKECLCRCKDSHCMHIESCIHFYKTICEIPETEIERFFDHIIACYMSWIDAQTTRSLETFEMLLHEYKLLSDKELQLKELKQRVLFRARISDSFLSKVEIFHVPFNKRYNIRNERFSLTGQPILYLGNSIADLVEELDADDGLNSDKLKNFRVASFEFNAERRIFDLRCNIFSDLKHCCPPTFSRQKFYRNILASICSFQKRRELADYAFTEEYIVPQILAQVLKQNHYDGICYYSTKDFEHYHICCSSDRLLKSELNMSYRENFAIFTHMNDKSSYDDVLREYLEISMPINLNNIRACGEEDLTGLLNTFAVEAEEANKSLKEEISSDEREKYRSIVINYNRAQSIVKFYKHVFHNLRYKDKEYSKTDYGKAQIQLLLGIINRLLASNVEAMVNVSKKDIPDENDKCFVIPCSIDGTEETPMPYREVHMQGKLHKACIGFICTRTNIIIEPNTKDGAFYDHCRSDISKGRFDFTTTDVKYAGSFIYRDYGVVTNINKGAFFENNKEYVEIFVKRIAEEEVLDSERKSIEECKKTFIEKYDSLHPLLKQAIPLLFKHLDAEENL